MRLIPAAAIGITLASALALASPAGGLDDPGGGLSDAHSSINPGSNTEDPSLEITATDLLLTGGGNEGVPANGRPSSCIVRQWNDDILNTGRPVRDQLATVDTMTDGEQYWTECSWLDAAPGEESIYYSGIFTYTPGQVGPTLEALARRAYERLPLPFPTPQTSPATDVVQTTGLPTWLWIDPGAFAPAEATEGLAGVTVTVTGTPRDVTWTMGDGETVTCDGPGTPYDPATAPERQDTDCSHIYQHVSATEPGGSYAASVVVTWDVSWSVTTASGSGLGTGLGGTFDPITRTTTFPMTVDELQAVITNPT